MLCASVRSAIAAQASSGAVPKQCPACHPASKRDGGLITTGPVRNARRPGGESMRRSPAPTYTRWGPSCPGAVRASAPQARDALACAKAARATVYPPDAQAPSPSRTRCRPNPGGRCSRKPRVEPCSACWRACKERRQSSYTVTGEHRGGHKPRTGSPWSHLRGVVLGGCPLVAPAQLQVKWHIYGRMYTCTCSHGHAGQSQ
eukprot:scaffold3428_cov379-Prasinococcus_capsulatus_cf.AAC.20